jgi:hypothetical protein
MTLEEAGAELARIFSGLQPPPWKAPIPSSPIHPSPSSDCVIEFVKDLLDVEITQVTFVTRPQPSQLPSQAARQLPDQSTTIRVESSSADDSRPRGARPRADLSGTSGPKIKRTSPSEKGDDP